MFTNHKQLEFIDYEVIDCSTYSSSYHPKNIKTDSPNDPGSRWSSGTNDQKQYIDLALKTPSIVATITFGKFSKIHVCNIKELKIYVSSKDKNWIEVLHGSLRNDTEKETLCLKYEENGCYIISEFVRIVPLAAWGMNFNYSVWYVELRGKKEEELIKKIVGSNEEIKNHESMRICLKFLRERSFKKECDSIAMKSGIFLEDKVLQRIYECVEKEQWEEIEEIVADAEKGGVFEEYIEKSAYICEWKKIGCNEESENWPEERGGHQLLMDKERNVFYLYGGWDGNQELGDFWEFDCSSEKWCKKSDNTRNEGGPGRRSCHKTVMHGEDRLFYVIGRYIPTEYQKESAWLKGEVYKYDLLREEWSVENGNSRCCGGPDNIYDHQIAYADGLLYVVGGRGFAKDEQFYSGLYEYNIGEKSWKVIRSDSFRPDNTPSLRGRVGHSLIYIPEGYFKGKHALFNESLVVIGGQRGKECFKEILFYSLKNDTVYKTEPFPFNSEGKLVQRSYLNKKGEIVVIFCYSKDKDVLMDVLCVYTYSITRNTWTKCIETGKIPSPRSAHQFIYNSNSDNFYLFGGNCSLVSIEKRCSDLWLLNLKKKNSKELLKELIFVIRKHRFLRMISKEDPGALDYLQTSVYEAVDHCLREKDFKKLCCEIYKTPKPMSVSEIVDEITLYFPDSMRPPTRTLQSLL